MKKELDHFLVKRFPEFFKDRYSSPTESCMSWGFECDDGWFKLLYEACALVENHQKNIKNNNEFRLKMKNEIESGAEVHENWKKQYEKDALEPMHVPEFVATQVKEKFGTLRFYYSGGDDYISGVIDSADSASSHTCEVCGNLGKTRNNGWVRTLCDTHAKKEDKAEDEQSPLIVGDAIYGLTLGAKKEFIITQIFDNHLVAKEVMRHYDSETYKESTTQSKENYMLKHMKTDMFNYYDATPMSE